MTPSSPSIRPLLVAAQCRAQIGASRPRDGNARRFELEGLRRALEAYDRKMLAALETLDDEPELDAALGADLLRSASARGAARPCRRPGYGGAWIASFTCATASASRRSTSSASKRKTLKHSAQHHSRAGAHPGTGGALGSKRFQAVRLTSPPAHPHSRPRRPQAHPRARRRRRHRS
jgi:hypothetical protein